MLAIGLMSGTSMDGVDAALIETNGQYHVKELGHVFLPFTSEQQLLFKAMEFAVKQCQGDLIESKKQFHSLLLKFLCIQFDLDTHEDSLEDLLQYSFIKKIFTSLTTYPKPLDLLPSQKTSCLADEERSELSQLQASKICEKNEGISSEQTKYSSMAGIFTNAGAGYSIFENLEYLSTKLHYQCIQKLIEKTKIPLDKVSIVGYHGQTVYHNPQKKLSIQLGYPQWLADQLQKPVIFNFRQADLNAEGQGAPLAPIYHQALAIRDQHIPLAVINCGGIANITFISGIRFEDVIGFDTGPGNNLLDRLIRQRTQGQEHYDQDGKYSSQGHIDESILNLLIEKAIIQNDRNYLQIPPPKSLDSYDLLLLPELTNLSLPNACRTLAAFTAHCIVKSFNFIDKNKWPTTFILAGGGWKNPTIRLELKKQLQQKLPNAFEILDADAIGWNNDSLEAQLMAYLAVRRLKNLTTAIPSVTHAHTATTGGEIFLNCNKTN